jgi:hypothetical protein
MSSRLSLPTRNADVSALLEFATQLFKQSLPSCLPLAMIAVLASAAAGFYWIGTGHKLDDKLPQDSTYWLLVVVGSLISLWLAAAQIRRQHLLCTSAVGSRRADLAAVAQRWSVLLPATVFGLLLTTVGMVALIVPGIYIAVCLVPLTPVVLFESCAPAAALRRSFELVKPMWMKVFAAILIAALILIVIMVTAKLVTGLLVAALAGTGKSAEALNTTLMLALMAAAQVFFCALCYSIYSAASSSA